MTQNNDIHDRFAEMLDAYITGGLTPEEGAELEAHAMACASCGAALRQATVADDSLRAIFSGVNPGADFEDRLIAGLRSPVVAGKIHPWVRRAATGVAAAILLGVVGHFGGDLVAKHGHDRVVASLLGDPTTQASSHEVVGLEQKTQVAGVNRAKTRSNLRQIGQAMDLYSNFRVDGKNLADGLLGGVEVAKSPQSIGSVTRKLAEVQLGRAGDAEVPQSFGVETGREWKDSNGRSFARDTSTPQIDNYYAMHGDELNKNLWSLPTNGPVATNGVTLGGEAGRQAGEKGAVAADAGSTRTFQGRFTTPAPADVQLYYKPQKDGLVTPSLGNDASKATEDMQKRGEDKEGLGIPALSTSAAKPQAKERALAEGQVDFDTGKQLSDTKGVQGAKDSTLLSVQAGASDQAGQGIADKLGGKPATAAGKNVTFGDGHVEFSQNALGDSNDHVVVPNPTTEQPKTPAPSTPSTGGTPPAPTTAAAVDSRKIIRTGQMEFEVDSFDSAFMQIKKIAAEESGFVASTDSEKLANGKVKGTVTLRCPPEHLDTLVLKLRGLGDLKTQRIAAQDVTKQFTDFESELKAARAMESRMLDIIKTGKGTVKDLVEAEKQLGVYREKIEHIEGELRFMGSQVALSTLNITMMERDIRTPFAALETELISAGIEAEDVEKARTDALKMIDDVKGRVIQSDLKKLDAGQLAATIVAEVSPDAAGPLGDKLKQLGRVARWEAERKQTAQGGTGAPAELRPTAKLERQATRFSVSLYNLANVAPRQTTSLTLVATDVEAAYREVLAAVNGDGKGPPIGRIVTSNLAAQKSEQVTGSITLEVKADQAAAIEAALRSAGSVLHLAVTENPDQNGVTSAKRGYSIALIAAVNVPARESQNVIVASKDVVTTYNKLLAVLRDPKQAAHVINSQLIEQEEDNVTGSVDFEIPVAARAAVDALLADGKTSDVVSRNVTRSPDTENTLADKVHLTVAINSAERLPPREMTRLTLEASDVQKALDTAAGLGGSDTRVLERTLNQQSNGVSTAHVMLDVPMSAAQATLDQLRAIGKVRAAESVKNPKVTGGPLARARFEVELGNSETLVAPEDGVGTSIRSGLKKALGGLLWSVQMVVIGLVLIGPFVVAVWVAWKLLRRGKRKATPAAG